MMSSMQPITAILSWVWKQYRLPHVRTDEGFSISFTMQTQEMDLWCWAAAASSVAFYFDPEGYRLQKEIVAATHGFDLDLEPDSDWDVEGPLSEALAFVGCFSTSESKPIGFRQALRELELGRPIIGHIDWGGGQGHAIAISGCRIDSAGGRYLTVKDPAVGSHIWAREQPMEWVLDDYCDMDGKWVASYFVKAP